MAAALAGVAVLATMPGNWLAEGPATARAGAGGRSPTLRLTSLQVVPARGLVDGERVTVRVAGGSYGTTYAVAECDPKAALLLLRPPASVQDGCDSRHNTLMTVAANGRASTSLHLAAILTTALGGADCRRSHCFLAVVALHSTGGARYLVHDLGFARDACAAPGSCQAPADAWDPSLGPAPVPGKPAPATATSALGAPELATRSRGLSASAGRKLVVALAPTVAGDLSAPGSVTAPFAGRLAPPPGATSTTSTSGSIPTTSTPESTGSGGAPGPAVGEGLLRLALEAPGTSWGPGRPSSTVVDATVTDLTTKEAVSTQQLVLFFGAKPFVYAGFTGPVNASNSYSLTLRVEPAAPGGKSSPGGKSAPGKMSEPAPGVAPAVTLLASELEVVTPANPQYLAYTYAPVVYGRSTSALHDVPLLMYCTVAPEAGGAEALSYVVVWSHEDGGTGFLPFLEWGRWGRMTDIEDAISFTVEADGSISGAHYLWGGEPASGFPDSQTALREVEKPFTGTWWGHHPVLRDATGNNDFSDQGTTPFRFQLAPVAAPGRGETRDSVMDANPFTYQVMGEEMARWYADSSTSASSPEPGEAGQYAVIDLDTSGRRVSSVAVGLRLSGYAKWFWSDLGWGYPLVGTGHVRTAVKLPLAWASRQVVGVEVAVEPPAAATGVKVRSLRVLRFTGTAIHQVPAPAPVVEPEKLSVAP
ncbi:MAG: neocarzinostatin apoprotein domain-containing protein [Acidimicrobiales bacterium]